MNEPFETLISAAVLAPSGDNMQPWRFDVDQIQRSITVKLDATRDTSPMNSGQRMSRIACGAAIENILQTANHNGLHASLELHGDHCTGLAAITLSGSAGRMEIPDEIANRHTNRKRYLPHELSNFDISELKIVTAEGDVEIEWLTNRSQIRAAAQAVGRADAKMFGQAAFLRAFLANVRHDKNPSDGLPVGTLGLSALESRMLPLLVHIPNLVLGPLFGWTFRAKAIALVRNASGLCIFKAKSGDWPNDLQLGQSLQRVWLHLTRLGFQVQPMMSIPVLANAGMASGDRGDSRLPAFAELGQRTPCAILRFGRAADATERTGRQPIHAVCDPVGENALQAICS